MNVSLGMVEWEEGRRSAPGTLGRKIAIALSVASLSALAIGSWLAAPDASQARSEAPVAEVALAAD